MRKRSGRRKVILLPRQLCDCFKNHSTFHCVIVLEATQDFPSESIIMPRSEGNSNPLLMRRILQRWHMEDMLLSCSGSPNIYFTNFHFSLFIYLSNKREKICIQITKMQLWFLLKRKGKQTTPTIFIVVPPANGDICWVLRTFINSPQIFNFVLTPKASTNMCLDLHNIGVTP